MSNKDTVVISLSHYNILRDFHTNILKNNVARMGNFDNYYNYYTLEEFESKQIADLEVEILKLKNDKVQKNKDYSELERELRIEKAKKTKSRIDKSWW